MRLKRFFLFFLITFMLQFNTHAYESVTYLFAGNTRTYINNVERTGSSLKTVCPDYFEINSDGTLKITDKADALFVQSMHARNIKVTPYLSNNWDRTLGRAAVANRVNFVTAIAAEVKAFECDGVNIDIQNLNELDRDAFTDFIRLLRTALPDKLISVCVAANPWGGTTGWQGSYDYTALGALSDQVFIMAYDEHYEGGTPGAVAGFSFVERSIIYALKYVPSSKIVLGIPFYGRCWKQDATTGGYGITVADVERLVSTCGATTWYDETAQCARALLTVSETDYAVIWGNRQLLSGVYDIWYENEASIEKKLSLISKYDLLGAGSWALGQEPEHFWLNYSSWLNGLPFTDIGTHWAQSYIINLYEKGIIKGMPDKRFEPEEGMTRAEAAILFVKTTGLQNETGQSFFSDITGHWAEEAISIAAQYGIFKGYEDNMFYPEKKITREEYAVICDRVLFSSSTVDFSQQLYSDVNPQTNEWSNKSIIILSMNNILAGYSDGTFKPNNTITRAEAVKVIKFMLDFPGGFTVAPNKIQNPIPLQPR
ncbi:MAG: S-layer homology domain-containing protein [Eubacteriales bacterium]